MPDVVRRGCGRSTLLFGNDILEARGTSGFVEIMPSESFFFGLGLGRLFRPAVDQRPLLRSAWTHPRASGALQCRYRFPVSTSSRRITKPVAARTHCEIKSR